MLPYEKGGLNMLNIGKFWESLKMSWIRRMQTSSDVWWQILQLNLLQLNCDITDLCYGGPNRFYDLSTKVSETLKITGNLMAESVFA